MRIEVQGVVFDFGFRIVLCRKSLKSPTSPKPLRLVRPAPNPESRTSPLSTLLRRSITEALKIAAKNLLFSHLEQGSGRANRFRAAGLCRPGGFADSARLELHVVVCPEPFYTSRT